jgi:hypothetical protein
MIFLLEDYTAGAAAVRFKSLQQLYGWLAAEEWIGADPMARLRPRCRNRCEASPVETSLSARSGPDLRHLADVLPCLSIARSRT